MGKIGELVKPNSLFHSPRHNGFRTMYLWPNLETTSRVETALLSVCLPICYPSVSSSVQSLHREVVLCVSEKQFNFLRFQLDRGAEDDEETKEVLLQM